MLVDSDVTFFLLVILAHPLSRVKKHLGVSSTAGN